MDESDGEKELEDIEETDKSHQLCNKLIEEIMSECGDMILKIFHNHNLTYSSGINFDCLIDIIKKSNDEKSGNILKMIEEKFRKRIIENFISGINKKKEIDKNDENKDQIKFKIHKREIKCMKCQNHSNTKDNDIDNNIFNSADRDQLVQLLILPNEFGFNHSENVK